MEKVYNFLIKTLLCVILFLSVAIMCKKNQEWYLMVQEKVYNDNISFSSFKNFYNRYLGGVFPLEDVVFSQTEKVFHEDLIYDEITNYEDGVVLGVSMNYLVPALEDGIVVYVGEKEKYGMVLIVENADGVNVWYGNMCNYSLKLYDTVKKGSYLGEVCDNQLYLVFTKDNKYLDYKDYLG